MTDLMTRPNPNDHDENSPGDHPDAGDNLNGPDDDSVTPPPPPPPPYGESSNPGRWPRRIAGGAAVLVLIGGGGVAGGAIADHFAGNQASPMSASSAGGSVVESNDLAAVVDKVQPSIVTVMVDGAQSSVLGSGVILNANGLILTNNHVIASGGTVSVRLSDGRTIPAKVVSADTQRDLALVQATGVSGLTPATFGNDDSVAVGDSVLAFGAPLGLANTVTSGIISAQNRSVNTGSEKLTGLLQTDAAINEGNSGGALVDLSGHVVGINVAIATASQTDQGSIGLGFAIPSNTVVNVVKQLQSRAR
ncbi:trypsin-like serine protease [Actinoplanes sp. TBRC 11911]|uniref:S1C family serine protease n=1 Tax=Actinoplanes sp. TBRC 11911 TaxID=2729386 RepID=UPI00145E0DC0|nr:trypsin-like peptidase domain-containing protein [Actinoplanes sp. TBRC 11911]NMO56649.1 trypsin-like serine protease [Actinoplanes sp. TBRC 11911]